MFGWAISFLFLAIVAGLLALLGLTGIAGQLAWILCVFGLILAVLFAVADRQPPLS
jgi:uncharacterized membrane protein YtjA (UPF0391 family)